MKARELTRIHAVMTSLLIVVVAQLVLLLVGVEGFARGERAVLAAATWGSGLCFLGALWLLRYIAPIEGRTGSARGGRG